MTSWQMNHSCQVPRRTTPAGKSATRQAARASCMFRRRDPRGSESSGPFLTGRQGRKRHAYLSSGRRDSLSLSDDGAKSRGPSWPAREAHGMTFAPVECMKDKAKAAWRVFRIRVRLWERLRQLQRSGKGEGPPSVRRPGHSPPGGTLEAKD